LAEYVVFISYGEDLNDYKRKTKNVVDMREGVEGVTL